MIMLFIVMSYLPSPLYNFGWTIQTPREAPMGIELRILTPPDSRPIKTVTKKKEKDFTSFGVY